MNETANKFPVALEGILKDTKRAGFDQMSDPQLGSFLSTLAASRPNGHFLELGTGSAIYRLDTSWNGLFIISYNY